MSGISEVFCIDATRVVLTWPPGFCDYINANWISGVDKAKKFICTQGPVEKTVDDFWRMIWQEKCRSIIMLCNITECGKSKCEQYWPLTAQHTVEHFHWTDWPDRGVPRTTTLAIFRILRRVNRLTPCVVHCSAGIGRTGTVVGIDMVYRRLERGEKDVSEYMIKKYLAYLVTELREMRHGAVQMDCQYVYMHRILLVVAENLKVHSILTRFLRL
uniref:Protein-tyrosine phosphatase n=1 Tax=Angiostrongylus cantonensis TaxID=6313 RepID=A0A0K0DAI8_ANGCA